MIPLPSLANYDRILVAFSGGEDPLAYLLHLLDLGVSPDRIELHHHDVDGGVPFRDRPCTSAIARRSRRGSAFHSIDPGGRAASAAK